MNAAVPLIVEHPVDSQTLRRLEAFLYREARLLDHEQWDQWLALMAEDIHYWMPAIENRRRADKRGAYAPNQMSYFDDNLQDLSRRVTRFKQPSAWAEDPPTRHVHVVTNIEAFAADESGHHVVHSTFVNYRSRGDADNDMLIGRREDLIRDSGADLKLVKRKIVITQAVLQAKNLNTFL